MPVKTKYGKHSVPEHDMPPKNRNEKKTKPAEDKKSLDISKNEE